MDSSMGSGSFVGNTSETWSFDSGMTVGAATTNSNQH